MGVLRLVLGGARSGKSRFAERLAAKYDRVIYLATGQVTDDEMADRVRRHQADRPAHWLTVEEGFAPAEALRPHLAPGAVVLLDCVSFLVTNHLLHDEDACEPGIIRELEALCALDVDIIAVSNEVGMSVVPEYRLGRLFRDLLGRANQHLAARADEVFLCVAGIAVNVKQLAWQEAP